MNIRFETYISSVPEVADKRFVLVAYQDGRGKFKVRRVLQESKIKYLISAPETEKYQRREQELTGIPQSLEQVFEAGALTISYVEGDALIEFPLEFESKLDQTTLQTLSTLALAGLAPLAKDFAEPIFEYEEKLSTSKSISAYYLCIVWALLVSLIALVYGSRILPLGWLEITAYCFIAVVILGAVLPKYTKALLRTGRVFTVSFFGISAVLLMLLLGVVSKELIPYEVLDQEGIIESPLHSSKVQMLRIRLASEPHRSHLISQDYFTQPIIRYPQAARLKVQIGILGIRYLEEISVVN